MMKQHDLELNCLKLNESHDAKTILLATNEVCVVALLGLGDTPLKLK